MRFFRTWYSPALTALAMCAACGSVSKNPAGPLGANASGAPATGWYAAPTGSSTGDGTRSKPWDLQTALTGGNGKVQPGDTVWLRGGTYGGTFTSSLAGASGAPITVRQFPTERATLDGGSASGATLQIDSQWANYWDFEVMQSGTQRFGAAGTGNGLRQTGVYVENAANVKLINLVIHDVGHGVYTENTAHNIELYGLVIYNGGYEDGTRSDGHGIYIKNDGIGSKVARDNVIFNQFGFGIHGYTEATGTLRHLVFDGNVLFNNGTVSSFQDNPNLQLGGQAVADNDTVTDNLLYFSPGLGQLNAKIGYKTLANGSALFARNYVVGGAEALDVGYWRNLSVRDNTFSGPDMIVEQHDANAPATQHWSNNAHLHDPATTAWQLGAPAAFATWQSEAGAADQVSDTRPAGPDVFVRPNWYEAGRATIVVYNWSEQPAIAVDLSSVLTPGSRYEIHNVQDLYGAPIAAGTYGGGSVSLPMNGVTPPPPIGGSPNAPTRTGPDFDVFVVTRA